MVDHNIDKSDQSSSAKATAEAENNVKWNDKDLPGLLPAVPVEAEAIRCRSVHEELDRELGLDGSNNTPIHDLASSVGTIDEKSIPVEGSAYPETPRLSDSGRNTVFFENEHGLSRPSYPPWHWSANCGRQDDQNYQHNAVLSAIESGHAHADKGHERAAGLHSSFLPSRRVSRDAFLKSATPAHGGSPEMPAPVDRVGHSSNSFFSPPFATKIFSEAAARAQGHRSDGRKIDDVSLEGGHMLERSAERVHQNILLAAANHDAGANPEIDFFSGFAANHARRRLQAIRRHRQRLLKCSSDGWNSDVESFSHAVGTIPAQIFGGRLWSDARQTLDNLKELRRHFPLRPSPRGSA